MGRQAFVIDFGWKSFTSMNRTFEATKHACVNLEKGFYRWFRSGGSLSRVAALDLAEYMKNEIEKNDVYTQNFPPLTEKWASMKRNKRGAKWGKAGGARWGGLVLDPRVGIAKKDMINSIKAIEQGHGKWKVGIPTNTRASNPLIGKIPYVDRYANILEQGSARQVPRPAFALMFLNWSREHAPKMADTLMTTLWPAMQRLMDQWGHTIPASAIKSAIVIQPPGAGEVTMPEGIVPNIAAPQLETSQIETPDISPADPNISQAMDIPTQLNKLNEQIGTKHDPVSAASTIQKGAKAVWDQTKKRWTQFANLAKKTASGIGGFFRGMGF